MNALERCTGDLVFGHRGYSSRAPENTMAAFALCRDEGIPAVELDIQRSADGRIVVHHDRSLLRCSGVDAVIDECAFAELRQADLGGGERIPLLSEVLALCADADMVVDIEIKSYLPPSAEFLDALRELVANGGMDGRVIVSSFDPRIIMAWKRMGAGIPSGLIWDDESLATIRAAGADPDAILPVCDFLKPHHPLAKGALAAYPGRTVLPWTVDDAETGRDLLRAGCGGLISNEPGLFA